MRSDSSTNVLKSSTPDYNIELYRCCLCLHELCKQMSKAPPIDIHMTAFMLLHYLHRKQHLPTREVAIVALACLFLSHKVQSTA